MVKPRKKSTFLGFLGRVFGRGDVADTDSRVNLTKHDSVLRGKKVIDMVKAELDEAVLYEVVPQTTQYFADYNLAPDSPPDYEAALPFLPNETAV